MIELREEELIHDWNRQGSQWPTTPPLLIDHTLPAAALTPSARLPEPERQAQLIRQMTSVGLNCFALGDWPGDRTQELFRHLLATHSTELDGGRLKCWVECGSRYLPTSRLQVYVSHRQTGWTSVIKQLGSRATLLLPDITRLHPDSLVQHLRNAIDHGGDSVCLIDDAGRATPVAVTHLVSFVRQLGDRLGVDLRIEWRGRNDRSLALYNALCAWRAGASALHCAFFGLGEGSGSVPTELLLVNLTLLGALRQDLRSLGQVSGQVARALMLEIPANLPVVGADAFRTGTGVHAAAIIKAHKKGHDWLADLIYSGVPANQFGFAQVIEVGPMAGASNVHHWLQRHGIEVSPERVQRILNYAKGREKVLSDAEIMALINDP